MCFSDEKECSNFLNKYHNRIVFFQSYYNGQMVYKNKTGSILISFFPLNSKKAYINKEFISNIWKSLDNDGKKLFRFETGFKNDSV